IPHYPSQKPTPTITLHHPTTLPHRNTPPTLHLPLTLTYPHATKHHVKLPLTVAEETQPNTNHPTYHNLTLEPRETIKLPQTGHNTIPHRTQ
ncbi:hypothetical protein, partial [Staphylococcus hominis]|uniref:hypothetical protein n=1 Tax=Staphylococcus hominis TaxID=1290 RepID=UPI0016430C79